MVGSKISHAEMTQFVHTMIDEHAPHMRGSQSGSGTIAARAGETDARGDDLFCGRLGRGEFSGSHEKLTGSGSDMDVSVEHSEKASGPGGSQTMVKTSQAFRERLSRGAIRNGATFSLGSVLSGFKSELLTRVHSLTALLRLQYSQRNHHERVRSLGVVTFVVHREPVAWVHRRNPSRTYRRPPVATIEPHSMSSTVSLAARTRSSHEPRYTQNLPRDCVCYHNRGYTSSTRALQREQPRPRNPPRRKPSMMNVDVVNVIGLKSAPASPMPASTRTGSKAANTAPNVVPVPRSKQTGIAINAPGNMPKPPGTSTWPKTLRNMSTSVLESSTKFSGAHVTSCRITGENARTGVLGKEKWLSSCPSQVCLFPLAFPYSSVANIGDSSLCFFSIRVQTLAIFQDIWSRRS